MEISLLKVLLNNISSFLHLSSYENIHVEPYYKYYQKVEELLKLLNPILDAIVDSRVASDEFLITAFEELGQAVDELRELFETWQPFSSKVYFVVQIELLISKIRTSGLDIFLLLKSSHQHLPVELSSASIELCAQKIKHIGYEQQSSVIKEAMRDQVEGIEPRSEILAKIADSLSLKSNQEVLIEAVALEKLKESAEQAEKAEEAEYIDQMVALVTQMHERLVMVKQSLCCSPVSIPTDFCCPLSLELMTDPVIVASGQTYERAFIRKWLDLGLTVCPKTRQALAHTNLIPNYTVKALIANWCESNNVKLPDPMKSMSLDQPSSILAHAESDAPRDSHMLSHARNHRQMSPEANRPTSSPARNVIPSSEVHRDGTSPLHPRSTSEGSLSDIAGNGQALDIGRVSLMGSDDRFANSEEINSMDGHPSMSPPTRREYSNADGADEQVSRGHNRAGSVSSTISNSNSQGTSGDVNDVSQMSVLSIVDGSDTSGEVRVESQPPATMNTPQRVHEFPSRMETRPRNQGMWRRPSERFGQRIIPSPSVEARADLSGIETQVKKLVEDLKSTSIETQRDATGELRVLSKHNMDNRIVIANCGAIPLLVDLLRSTDTKIQEYAVTALLNLSINDNNKTLIGSAGAIEPLIHVLKTGTPEAKENSAATLFSLSVVEDNKVRIGRAGAVGPLVELLGHGTPRGKKDAATALYNLSIFHENKARIVQDGAVKYLVDLMDPAAGMVDKAVAVLSNLSTIPEGRTAIGQEGGIPVLVEVVELGSARVKENAAAALLQLCSMSSRYCNMVLQEGAIPPLVALSQNGTPRAKEKAQALLSCFRNHRHGNSGRG